MSQTTASGNQPRHDISSVTHRLEDLYELSELEGTAPLRKLDGYKKFNPTGYRMGSVELVWRNGYRSYYSKTPAYDKDTGEKKRDPKYGSLDTMDLHQAIDLIHDIYSGRTEQSGSLTPQGKDWTFQKVFQYWQDHRQDDPDMKPVRDTTFKTCIRYQDEFIEHHGKTLRLGEWTRHRLMAWKKHLLTLTHPFKGTPITKGTANLMISSVSAAYEYALEHDVINSVNCNKPFKQWPKSALNKVDPDTVRIEPGELGAMYRLAGAGNGLGSSKVLFALMVGTGMRPHVPLKLQVKHLDMENRVVKGSMLQEYDSKKVNDTLMPEFLYEHLIAERDARGGWQDEDYVVLNASGTGPIGTRAGTRWHTLRKNAGIKRHFSPKALRHTLITTAQLEENMPVAVRLTWFGHSEKEHRDTGAQVYTHVKTKDQGDAVNAASAFWSKAMSHANQTNVVRIDAV